VPLAVDERAPARAAPPGALATMTQAHRYPECPVSSAHTSRHEPALHIVERAWAGPCRGCRHSPCDNRGPHVFRLAEKWKGFLSLHERRRRNPLQGACHAPGHRGLAAVRAEPRGMCGLVSEGRARSIGEGLSRRSTLTIRDRRPLSAQNRPSKRSDETATTALQGSPVAPVRDLLALAVLPTEQPQ
jgi:hypothetical protein